MQRALLVVLILCLAAPLAGCGRKSAPEKPPGSQFPRTYPTQ